MKNIFFILFLCVSALTSYGQNQDWKIIGAPDSTSIDIIYVSSHGYIFGSQTESGQMMMSKDDGKTWLEFYGQTNSYNAGVFTEDADRSIYFADKNVIYKLDPNTLVAIKFVTVVDAYELDHITFMDNGNLVVAESRSLNLYNNIGVLLKSHSWWTHSAIILPGKGTQKNYVTNSHGASYSILEFSDDLTYIGNEMSIPYSENVVRKNDTLFINNQFSIDEGKTWKTIYKFKDKYFYNIHLGRDNKLYFLGYDSLYISADNGLNFDIKINLGNTTMIFADFSGNLVAYKTGCEKSFIYLSKNNGNTWQAQNVKIGDPISNIIAAGIDENIYTYDQCYSQRYKSNVIASWKKLEIDSLEWNRLNKVVPISNGGILGIGEYSGLYTSLDQGESWSLINDNLYIRLREGNIIEKGRTLFTIAYDTLFYSNDFGRNWKSIFISNQDVISSLFFNERFAISHNFNIFYFNEFSNDGLNRFNLLTQKNVPIELPSNFYYSLSETAYNSENLYVICSKSNDNKSYIAVSSDLGMTFNTYLIPGFEMYANLHIKTDHLNNIYVFSSKTVIMSVDEGKTWIEITPTFTNLVSINDLQVSYDNYIYLATTGMGILKYKTQLQEPNKIIVNVYDDINKNCTKDLNEPGLQGVKILFNNQDIHQVNQEGQATSYVLKSKNELSLLYNTTLYEACQTKYDVNFDSSTSVITIDIPLKTIKFCADPKVNISADRLRRCFDNTYQGTVCNEGSITSENTKLKIDLDPFFELKSVSLPIISHVGNELVLNAGNIKSAECSYFNLVVAVTCEATLGQEHCIEVTPSTTSANCPLPIAKGLYKECQPNIGSYDPNDKAIFTNGVRNASYVELDDKMEYMIRFQNTGTDTAFTVRIEDPISTKFDITTLST